MIKTISKEEKKKSISRSSERMVDKSISKDEEIQISKPKTKWAKTKEINTEVYRKELKDNQSNEKESNIEKISEEPLEEEKTKKKKGCYINSLHSNEIEFKVQENSNTTHTSRLKDCMFSQTNHSQQSDVSKRSKSKSIS